MATTGISGTEATPRVRSLKERFLNARPWMCCDRAVIYTEAYQRHEDAPVVLKRAIALRETLSRMPIFIEPGEVIVGHPASKPRAAEVFPEVNMKFMEDIDEFETREYNRLHVPPEVKSALLAMQPYWRGRTLTEHFARVRTPEVQAAIQAGLLSNPHEWSGFAHVGMDYRKILAHGIDGMRRQVEDALASTPISSPDHAARAAFHRACLEVCDGTLALAGRYRELALKMSRTVDEPVRKAELAAMAEILGNVPARPAGSFREAVQSFWFMQLIPQIESNGFSITPGRFDQYMWPYLEADLNKGAVTMDEAQELVDMLFLKFAEIMRVDSTGAAEVNAGYASGQNLAVGGIDSDGNDASNPLSYICLAANHRVRLHQPNFTARLHRNTPKHFLDAVIESIGAGNGMPQLLNDELIVRSLAGHGVPLREARDYIPVGCDEITTHRHWGRCNGGYVNFAKVLEITMGGGVDLRSDRRIGLSLPADGCRNLDEFLALFDRQLRHAVHMQICDANNADYIHRELLPLPFVSLFMDDCVAAGRDVTDGGARHNTTGLVGVGTANAADSLAAIGAMVFTQGRLSLSDYREMLRRNFRDDEATRQYIINRLPKYGNDIDAVDQLAVHVTNVFFDEVEAGRNFRGGALWPALYSVSAQIGLGNHTAATPDGRLAGMPLADGLTPMYGLDAGGPTAALKSEAKIDQGRSPNGVIINQRLTKNLFLSPQGRKKLPQLLRTFVDLDSFHWQFNIVDNETLRKAQESPDEYRSLVVRVAGYSAIFVELSLKAQNSIIERYEGDLA